MAQTNSTILQRTWLAATSDYQQRIPSSDVATQQQVVDALFSPLNGNCYNQFCDSLVNRIGLVVARGQSWRNPLAIFQKERLLFGQTVEELAVQWIRGHAYADDIQDLLKIHRPEVAAAMHSINREVQYPISLNRMELKQAFTDEYGLNRLVAAIMEAPINSEQYDQFLTMKNLLAIYESKWGFFKHQLALPTTDSTAKAFLKALKTYVAKLQFPSTLYNNSEIPVPVFAKPNELVLLIDASASASVDVDALATLFNLEPADTKISRKIILDEFPINGAYALLTTKDFFQCYPVDYENGSFYNPQTLTTNYYLTVREIDSVSPFVPAILFTTESGTSIPTITQTVSTNSVTPTLRTRTEHGNMVDVTVTTGAATITETGDAAVRQLLGDNLGIFVGAVQQGVLGDGTLSNQERIGAIEVAPDAAVMTVTGITSGANSIVPNSRSRVDRLGRLRLQKAAVDSIAAGTTTVVTVTLQPTYINPSGATPTPTATTLVITFNPTTTEAPAAAGGGE